ncbi:MAG: hypothetical protein HYX68_29540 [Planctomycetes bacterium]|nr:hypothetical protein [Planctomycetota bacterium]
MSTTTSTELEEELESKKFQDAVQAVAFLTTRSGSDRRISLPNPFLGGLEGQFWRWNRIAGQFIKQDKADQALEVWSAMYLSLLAIQGRYHQRLHKGMALCNIGYALGKIHGERANQAKSWILGIIEDIFTDVDSVEEGLNHKNLLSMQNVTAPRIRQLVSAVRLRVFDEAITPLFPESCVDFIVTPAVDAPSIVALKYIGDLQSCINSASPDLPREDGTYWNVLKKCWSFLDWSKGVISDD